MIPMVATAMDIAKSVALHPFTWGFLVGLFLLGLSMWGHFKTRREFSRFRRHLSDKLELEAKQYEGVRKEKDVLQKENENLRVQIATLSEKPDQRISKDLEILARAEKQLMISAPGFSAAWETAKSQAMEEIQDEETGKSLPKRIFRKLFHGAKDGNQVVDALPSSSETDIEFGTTTDSEPTSAEEKS